MASSLSLSLSLPFSPSSSCLEPKWLEPKWLLSILSLSLSLLRSFARFFCSISCCTHRDGYVPLRVFFIWDFPDFIAESRARARTVHRLLHVCREPALLKDMRYFVWYSVISAATSPGRAFAWCLLFTCSLHLHMWFWSRNAASHRVKPLSLRTLILFQEHAGGGGGSEARPRISPAHDCLNLPEYEIPRPADTCGRHELHLLCAWAAAMSAKVSGGMAAARSMLEGRSRADSCRMMLLDRFQIAGLGRLNRTLNAAAKLRNSRSTCPQGCVAAQPAACAVTGWKHIQQAYKLN